MLVKGKTKKFLIISRHDIVNNCFIQNDLPVLYWHLHQEESQTFHISFKLGLCTIRSTAFSVLVVYVSSLFDRIFSYIWMP